MAVFDWSEKKEGEEEEEGEKEGEDEEEGEEGKKKEQRKKRSQERLERRHRIGRLINLAFVIGFKVTELNGKYLRARSQKAVMWKPVGRSLWHILKVVGSHWGCLVDEGFCLVGEPLCTGAERKAAGQEGH